MRARRGPRLYKVNTSRFRAYRFRRVWKRAGLGAYTEVEVEVS